MTHLAPREKEVIELIKAGKQNKEIGREMGITGNTVRQYLTCIFKKVSVTNRTQLAMWSRDQQEPDR